MKTQQLDLSKTAINTARLKKDRNEQAALQTEGH